MFWIATALLIAVALAGGAFWVYSWFLPIDELLKRGAEEIVAKRWESAASYGERIVQRDPESGRGLLMAGQALSNTDRYDDALDYLSRIPDSDDRIAIMARCIAGNVWLNKKMNPSEAEDRFRRALAQDPYSLDANNFLGHLMHLGTRTWERIPFEIATIRKGAASPRKLYQLALGDKLHTDVAAVKKFAETDPDNPNIRLGLADLAVYEKRRQDAERLLVGVTKSHPEILEAHIRLGAIFLDSDDRAKFLKWHDNLPESIDEHPGVWIIRGAWAKNHGQPRVAARCYWEALRKDPNHQAANYQLGQLLVAEEKPEQAKPFLARSEKLQKYLDAVHLLNSKAGADGPDPAAVIDATRMATELGLLWEGAGWLRLAMVLLPENEELKKAAEDSMPVLEKLPLERTVAAANPTNDLDLSDYPLPDWSNEAADNLPAKTTTDGQKGVRFRNDAPSAGIEFQYVNGGRSDLRGISRVYEFTGGGAAVLDYDCDGWPDVYLTQGNADPQAAGDATHTDRLFRNRGDGRFEDVTIDAGIVEDRYGQGVAVGDYNNDGFPDLYIANIGPNRLYENNGDGTFSNITETTATAGDDWTTSCLLADVDGDSLPDIYAVNYLSGSDVFTTACRDETGNKIHACMPLQFAGAQDRLYLNQGDGHFEDVTQSAGLIAPDGKGLGIVAADFDGSGKISLFIANDGQPNSFFTNESSDAGKPIRFGQHALRLGLAYNEEGRHEACMGVAAGDTNGNGLIDLFVTNFSEETNTLYRQRSGGLFLDETRLSKLADPGFHMLGFGTQFLDADLDGWLDLIVANGHIDTYEKADVAYEMPAQYFSNTGGSTFVEKSPEQLGAYFQEKLLGRGLARLDWNRDGRQDAVVSHLDAPAALLTNITDTQAHYLGIKLVGTTSARDAIGSTVTLIAGTKTLTRQLTAGDGYQASNQRQLIFGLGDANSVDELHIRWPSGHEQTLAHLEADATYLFVEGQDAATMLAVQ